MRLAAERSGFRVYHVEFDATGFDYWGSEQYLMDIPLTDQRSGWLRPDRPGGDLFSPEQLAAFERQAAEDNARGSGGQACFYLQRCSSPIPSDGTPIRRGRRPL